MTTLYKSTLLTFSLLLWTTLIPTVLASDKPTTVQLTPAERAFLAAHPIIRFGTDRSWAPYVKLRDNGTIDGLEPDLLARLNALTGTNIQLELGDWADIVKQAESGELDGLAISAAHPERATHFLFSDSPYSTSRYIFTRGGQASSIHTMEELAGKKVGIQHGNLVEQKLLARWPQITPVTFDSAADLAVGLLNSQVDAALSSMAFLLMVRENLLPEIDLAFAVPNSEVRLLYSIRKEYPELLSIVNKGLAAIGQDEINRILSKWNPRTNATIPQISLTAEERAWLAKHPNILLGSTNHFQPDVIVNSDGSYAGFVVDYLNLLNQRLGNRFQLHVDSDWRTATDKAIRHEIDGLAASAPNPTWDKHFLYSDPYAYHYFYLYTRADAPHHGNQTTDLAGKRVGYLAGIKKIEHLLQNLPGVQLIALNGNEALANALLEEQVDVVVSLANLEWWRKQHGNFAFKTAGILADSRFPVVISIRKDWPLLPNIINKVLKTLTAEDHERIHQRWIQSLESMPAQVELTPAERAFLDQHPVIRFGSDGTFIPYVKSQPDGTVIGLEPDLLARINALTGANIRLEIGKWAEVVARAERGELEGLATSASQPERATTFFFSHSPYSTYYYIHAPGGKTSPWRSMADLAGKKVGFMKGVRQAQKLLERWPAIIPVSKDTPADLVAALVNGEVDAVIAIVALRQLLHEQMFREFDIAFAVPDSETPLLYSIRKEYPELLSIVNKAMAAIGPDEIRALLEKWGAYYDDTATANQKSGSPLPLTDEERAWVSEHPVVRARATRFPPYHFWENGAKGISVELLNKIAEKAGFRVEYVSPDMTWPEALERIRKQDGLDVLLTARHTPELEAFLNFSQDYLSLPWVIFTRENDHRIFSLEDLYGKTIAVERGYALQEKLTKDYPRIQQLVTVDAALALAAVSNGKVDAYIGNLTVAQFHIAKEGFTNLKVAADTGLGNHTQAFAVRKDWPQLASIIDKGLASITHEERNAIQRKYFSLELHERIDYTRLLQVAGTALFIIVMILYWNHKLARSRKQLQHAQTIAQANAERLRSVLASMDDLVFVLDAQGRFAESYQDDLETMMMSPAAFIGKHYREILPEPLCMQLDEAIAHATAGGAQQFEYPLEVRTGLRWFNASLSARYDSQGEFAGCTSVVRDITERRHVEQQLKENTELLELIFQLNPDSTIITRLTDGVVIKVNEGFTTMSGFPPEEVVGKQTVDLDFWENTEDRQHVIDELRSKGICENYEAIFKRKDGSRLVGILSARLFTLQGVPHVITVTRNITERKLAERAMHDSQMRYQSLVDDIGPNFIVYSHLDNGVLEYVSKGIENIFGIPPAQAIGQNFGEIIPWQPGTLATSWEKVRHMLATGESVVQWEMYFDRPDGTTGTILVTSHPVKGEDGTYNRIEGMVEDITKRKQTELDLRQSEERYHSVITAMAEGVVMQNRNGEIIECNAAAERILGLSKEQMRGRTSLAPNWRAVREDGAPFPGEEHPLPMALRTGQSQRNVVHGVHQPNGNLRWILVNAEPLFQPGAKLPYAGVATFTDVTNSRTAAQQIEEQRRTLQTVLDHLPAAVQVFSAPTAIPLLSNRQAQELLEQEIKHTDIEKLNTHYGAFIYGTDIYYPPEKMPLVRALKGEISMVEDMELCRLDGSKILLQVIGAPIFDEKQNITAGVVIFLDITLRKQTELELIKAREAAEAANRAKSAFIANMSHELRTPLNAVLGFAQILQRDPSLGNHQHEQVQRIQSGGEYLLTLINDILDLAKIEAGRFELFPEIWDTRSVFQELAYMFRIRTEPKNLDFQYEQVTPLPYSLYCDHKRLRQILINLLGNAVKFTERGGVTLRTGYEAEKLWLEVVDSGIGIAAADLGKIFEPFRQTGTDHYKMQGTGLGLAITYRLVQAMDGTLQVDSTLGQGSVFHVEVPAKAMSTTADFHSPVNQPTVIGYHRTEKGGPLRILGVDDLADNRRILHQLLEPLGFAVEEAENGQHCLDLVPNYQPEVIFMDLRMPDLDGLQVTRRLRAQGFQMPIIALSASTFADDRAACLEAGCTAHLAKPVRLSEVLETLAQWLPLEWKYADTPVQDAVAEEQTLETLTVEQAERIRNLNQIGDIVGLKEFAQDLEASRPQLAKKLSDWVNAFEFDKIEKLVEKSREA